MQSMFKHFPLLFQTVQQNNTSTSCNNYLFLFFQNSFEAESVELWPLMRTQSTSRMKEI